MRIRLRILGFTVASFTVDTGPLLELLDEDDEPEAPTGITGGANMWFERDGAPLAANHEEPWYGEDKFGFHE